MTPEVQHFGPVSVAFNRWFTSGIDVRWHWQQMDGGKASALTAFDSSEPMLTRRDYRS